LGLPDIRGRGHLVLALGVGALGTGLAGPILLLYLIRVATFTLRDAGLLLTASGLVALGVPAFVGVALRRTGPAAVVLAAQGLQAAGAAGLVITALPGRRLPLVVTGCCILLSLGQRAFWSSIFGLLADTGDAAASGRRGATADRRRQEWFALAGMLQGTGFSVGALITGVLLVAPGPTPYVVGMGLGAAGFALSGLLLRGGAPQRRPDPHRRSSGRIHDDGPYLAFIGVNTLFAYCSTVLGVGLPLYIVDGLRAPAWLIGPLLALNTVLGATCQGLAVRKSAPFPIVTMLAATGALWLGWGLATAALSLAPMTVVVPGLVITVILYSIAELIHAPLSMGLAADASPEQSRAEHLAWFQYSFAVATTLAPGAFALTYALGPAIPWLMSAGVAAVAAVGILVIGPPLRARAQRG